MLENFVGCLDRSWKFLVVASPAYLSDRWCDFESSLAADRMLVADEVRDRTAGSRLFFDSFVVLLVDGGEPNLALKDVSRGNAALRTMLRSAMVCPPDDEKRDAFFAKIRRKLAAGVASEC